MQEENFQDKIKEDQIARKAAFNILGLEETLSQKDIRKAWRTACKKHHPDRSNDPEAQGQFILARCAYRFLADNDRSCQDILLKYWEKVSDNADSDTPPDNKWAFFLWWRERFF